jgi:hypothetical protein
MISTKWGEPQSAPLSYNENESSSPESGMKRVDPSAAVVRGYRVNAWHLVKVASTSQWQRAVSKDQKENATAGI